MTDTIYALSSAPGRAGVAVVRVSGPAAGQVAIALARELPRARQAALRTIRTAQGESIDQGLLLWMPGPHSFTGEDVAEFHLHGGRAILGALLNEIGRIEGTRPAQPGEFTRRALESGKLDLTQAEAIIDLVDAETEAQRRQALRQYGGALSNVYDGWRDRLVKSLAWTEAEIDFSDEDLPGELIQRSRHSAMEVAQEIEQHLNDGRRGELIREGVHLAIVGPPNAGKSSLINALAQRDVAIVHDRPGTTRDVLEVKLDIGGVAVVVADTAGLREARDAVEREGVRRALARAESADMVLLLADSSDSRPPDLAGFRSETADLVVWNKSDLGSTDRIGLKLSVKTGEGLEQLLAEIERRVQERLDRGGEAPLLTRSRHRAALRIGAECLRRGLEATDAEFFAEDVRLAVRAIGTITGRVDVEDLLDAIFRDFCIGK